MKAGELYLKEMDGQLIEIMTVRRRNNKGIAEVCWSTVNAEEKQGFTEMSGQFGWNTNQEILNNYTKIGEL